MSSILKQKELPLIITVVTALLMFGEFTFVNEPIQNVASSLRGWSLIISGWVSIVGYFTLLKHHSTEMMKRKSTSYLNAIAIFSSLLMIIVGLYFGTKSNLYNALYTAIPSTVSTTMWSIMGVFLMIGVYRAFIAKNIEGTLFLLAAAVIMLANAPVGSVIWPGFPIVADWLQKNIQRTALRALVLTGALGAIIAGFRTLLGEEAGYLKRMLGEGE